LVGPSSAVSSPPSPTHSSNMSARASLRISAGRRRLRTSTGSRPNRRATLASGGHCDTYGREARRSRQRSIGAFGKPRQRRPERARRADVAREARQLPFVVARDRIGFQSARGKQVISTQLDESSFHWPRASEECRTSNISSICGPSGTIDGRAIVVMAESREKNNADAEQEGTEPGGQGSTKSANLREARVRSGKDAPSGSDEEEVARQASRQATCLADRQIARLVVVASLDIGTIARAGSSIAADPLSWASTHSTRRLRRERHGRHKGSRHERSSRRSPGTATMEPTG
jgi:hypothetical protein